MLKFKSCSRCHGDVHVARDHYGPYLQCFQCGHILTDLEERVLMGLPLLVHVPSLKPAMENAEEHVAA
ncbi:MAG: hypothetical protein HYX97_01935 [Chloroflexi bacterium]|nr:hypothetical protein [Chloroflexota bacterium]